MTLLISKKNAKLLGNFLVVLSAAIFSTPNDAAAAEGTSSSRYRYCGDGVKQASEVCEKSGNIGCPKGKICNAICTACMVYATPAGPFIGCTDSDGGINYGEKGTTISGTITRTDSCYDSAVGFVDTCTDTDEPHFCAVEEFYCIENDIYVVRNYHACTNGCTDGKCNLPLAPTPVTPE